MSASKDVKAALELLCEEHKPCFAGDHRLFTAKRVALLAWVSVSTARKHLNHLAQCQGFERYKGKHRSSMGYRVSPF